MKKIKEFEAIDVYPVISSEFCLSRPPLDILKSVADGGAKVVQLREKNMTKKEIFKLALKYREITDSYSMLLILNDHIDIALACGADGVHLGQDDLPIETAVKLAPELIIGSSTHSIEEAVEAQNAGASYINIGPLFPTGTKSLPMDALGIETLKKVLPYVHVPFTVMGGIKARHIPELIQAGARRIAMVTEITAAEDVSSRVQELRTLWH